MSTDRPKRASAQKKRTMSTAHWVGYVDDAETPEMIMKKFEELDRLQSKGTEPEKPNQELSSHEKDSELDEKGEKAESTENVNELQEVENEKCPEKSGLNEAQLEELFWRTSSIPAINGNLELALSMNDELEVLIDDALDRDYFAADHLEEEEDEEFSSEEEYIDDFRESFLETQRRRTSGGSDRIRIRHEGEYFDYDLEDEWGMARDESSSSAREKVMTSRAKARHASHLDHSVLMAPLDFKYLRGHIKKKNTAPHSWAVTIRPKHHEKLSDENAKHIEADIVTFDFKSLGRRFYALYMDVPWRIPANEKQQNYLSVEDFGKLKLFDLAVNFIFVWVYKELQADVVEFFGMNGFDYIENLVWVKITSDNEFIRQDHYPYYRTKHTLFMFKRKNIKPKIQHQRSADVLFETAKPGKYLTEDKPDAVYEVIETMLHEAAYQEGRPSDLLEIWSKKGKRRIGWTCISQRIPDSEDAMDIDEPRSVSSNEPSSLEIVPVSKSELANAEPSVAPPVIFASEGAVKTVRDVPTPPLPIPSLNLTLNPVPKQARRSKQPAPTSSTPASNTPTISTEASDIPKPSRPISEMSNSPPVQPLAGTGITTSLVPPAIRTAPKPVQAAPKKLSHSYHMNADGFDSLFVQSTSSPPLRSLPPNAPPNTPPNAPPNPLLPAYSNPYAFPYPPSVYPNTSYPPYPYANPMNPPYHSAPYQPPVYPPFPYPPAQTPLQTPRSTYPLQHPRGGPSYFAPPQPRSQIEPITIPDDDDDSDTRSAPHPGHSNAQISKKRPFEDNEDPNEKGSNSMDFNSTG